MADSGKKGERKEEPARPAGTVVSPGRRQLREAVRRMSWCAPEHIAHAGQVCRLALRLYDNLATWHGLGAPERLLLECAALLHDIGWVQGPRGHHKTGQGMILDTPLLPLEREARLILGAVVRYHRGRPPRRRHRLFAELTPPHQAVVLVLAGILRIADALDRSHAGLVRRLRGRVEGQTLVLDLRAAGPLEEDLAALRLKGTMLAKVLGRKIRVQCRLPRGCKTGE